MLTRLFHSWEHRLASATKDRVVRPFEWGLDWLPNALDDELADPEHRIERWAAGAMADSEEFFRPPPTDAFEFVDADAPTRASGEAGTLRFPSALTTPHPENNFVYGRWFPAAGEAAPGEEGTRGR